MGNEGNEGKDISLNEVISSLQPLLALPSSDERPIPIRVRAPRA
jgi:hypothetical protein